MSNLVHVCRQCRWYNRNWRSCTNLRLLLSYIRHLPKADKAKAEETARYVVIHGSYPVDACRDAEPLCIWFDRPTLWERFKAVLG